MNNDDDNPEELFPEPVKTPGGYETVWPDHRGLARRYELEEETVVRLLRCVYAANQFGCTAATIAPLEDVTGGCLVRLYGRRHCYLLACAAFRVRLAAVSLDAAPPAGARPLFDGRDTLQGWSRVARRIAREEDVCYTDMWGSGDDDEGD